MRAGPARQARLLPALKMKSGCGLLQLDLSNAFNTVSRQAILRQIQRTVPSLLPWARWSQSLLFCRDQVLRSKSGVHQGSPLGPLMFSLALHDVITKLGRMVFYLDDGTVYGSLALLDEVVARLRAFLPTVGQKSQKSLRDCIMKQF